MRTEQLPSRKEKASLDGLVGSTTKKKVAITYRDGCTATWNVGNNVVAHSEEAYEEGITTCELYLQFVQRQSRRTYKNRRSYREMNESVPRTVPPDKYQDDASPIASRIYAMQADAGSGGNGTDIAIQELTNTLRELMHITRETSNRVRGLEERVSRVEMRRCQMQCPERLRMMKQFLAEKSEKLDEICRKIIFLLISIEFQDIV